MSERAEARLVGIERTGKTPTRIVQVLDQDGNFLGVDPTDEQIEEIAQKQGFSGRERNILWLDTLNYHQALARTGLLELQSDIGDVAFGLGMPGYRTPETENDILNKIAMGIRNHTTNDRDEGENDE